MSTPNLSPVQHPRVRIGGQSLELRFTLVAEYKLSEWGVNLADFLKCLRPDSKDQRRYSLGIALFAACVAHHYVTAGEPVPTGEQWMVNIEAATPDIQDRKKALGDIITAVYQEVTRHLDEVKKLLPSQQPVQEVTAQPDPAA